MKNPFTKLLLMHHTLKSLRAFPGLFSLPDAIKQIHRVLLPARVNDFLAGVQMKKMLRMHSNALRPDVARIDCLPLGVHFYWKMPLSNNLFYMAEQECYDQNPHFYTSPPIQVQETSIIFDIGACEGLFAFRMATSLPQASIHCFEPFAEMAQLLQQGADSNQLAPQINIHPIAMGKEVGHVKFMDHDCPDAGTVRPCTPNEPNALISSTIDRFCQDQPLSLTRHDLIKIDAEGADFDVLMGAEAMIRKYQPQIAITTYHEDAHAEAIYRWLNALELGYKFRLKGFSFWTSRPRPVLLLASTLD
jgi:FkbM family methyltransferase